MQHWRLQHQLLHTNPLLLLLLLCHSSDTTHDLRPASLSASSIGAAASDAGTSPLSLLEFTLSTLLSKAGGSSRHDSSMQVR
jgi:hypothetical protein